jgi:hypothetical protein
MRKGTLSSLIAVLSLASLPAFAADKGIYLGGSVGVSGISENDINYNANATGFKAIAGWRFLNWLSNGVSLSAVGFLPLGPFDLFARVGAFDWSASASSSSIGNFGDNGTDITYGAGAQFRLLSMSFRGEYERFDLGGTDVDLFSVGFTWTFF